MENYTQNNINLGSNKKYKLEIKIISDPICPWCIIGYKRLEKALNFYDNNVDTKVIWCPYELNPSMPKGGKNIDHHVADIHNWSMEYIRSLRKKITNIGAEEGFTFNYSKDMQTYNTRAAHKLLYWSKNSGKQTELSLKIFDYFFTHNKSIEDFNVLLSITEEVELDVATAQKVLNDEYYDIKVEEEEKKWDNFGIKSVPSIFINGQYIGGGRTVDEFKSIISKILYND